MSRAPAARIAQFLARPPIARLLDALNGDGVETRIIGGAVRDLLLGVAVGDVDLATTATPQETTRLGQAAGYKVVPTGFEHGTVTLVRDGASFEVTTLRRDVETDGRRAKVAFGQDFGEDAHRRDFTVNALGLDRLGVVHDFCDGLADLAERRIRFIGDPAARIAEDYLRILRFFRFNARYGNGAFDRAGLAACIAGRAGLASLSRERLRAEMLKLLVAPRAADALETMAATGLLMPIIGTVPYLARFRAIAEEEDGEAVYPAFRLAALAVSVREDALALRERMRLSNGESDRVERIARALEALSGRELRFAVADIRRVAQRVGADAVAAGLVLLTASLAQNHRDEAQRLTAELALTPPFRPSGRDALALGVPAGPQVGRVLDLARELWIEAGCPPDTGQQRGCLERAVAAPAR